MWKKNSIHQLLKTILASFIYSKKAYSISFSNFLKTSTPIDNFVITGINENNGPVSFDLGQNFPNPFNGSTQFNLNLVKSSDVTVEVYNVLGKLVKSATYENLQAGVNTIAINASDLSAGLYSYRVVVGSEMATRTMIVK